MLGEIESAKKRNGKTNPPLRKLNAAKENGRVLRQSGDGSDKRSAISSQPSAVGGQPSAVGDQPSVAPAILQGGAYATAESGAE